MLRLLPPALARSVHCAKRLFGIATIAILIGVFRSIEPAGAQYIAVERDHYYPGETVQVHYRFASLAGNHRIDVNGPSGGRTTGTYIDPRNPNNSDLAGIITVPVEDLVQEFRGNTFAGVSVRITHQAIGGRGERLVAERYLTIINDVQSIPRSLRLAGHRFESGQTINVGVTAPPAPPDVTWPTGALILHRPARTLPGGATLPASTEHLHDVQHEATYPVVVPTEPGSYELQLHDLDGYIVDKARFDVGFAISAISLKAVGQGPYPVGSTVTVEVPSMVFPRRFDALRFFVLVPDGRGGWKAPEQWVYPHRIDAPRDDGTTQRVPSSHTVEVTLNDPGPHRLIAYWEIGRLKIAAATLDIEATVARADGEDSATNASLENAWPVVSLPDGPIFTQDQAIDVALNGTMDHVDGPLELQLFKLSEEESVGPIRLREPIPGGPDARWDVVLPAVVSLPPDLAVGTYEVYVFGSRRGIEEEGPFMFAADRFSVVPPENSAALIVNSNRPVIAGSRFDVEIELPKDADPNDRRLSLQLVYLGGDLPGCHEVMETVWSMAELEDGGATVKIGQDDFVKPLPGEYEARLYVTETALPADKWPNAVMLGAQRFEVVYPPAAARLSLLSSPHPTEEDDVLVRVVAPPEMRGLLDLGALSVEAVRVGEYALSGAVRPPKSALRHTFHSGPEANLGPLRPGVYDLRLNLIEQVCLLGPCRSSLLDQRRITVRHKVWKGSAILISSRAGPTGLGVAGGEQAYPPIGLRGSCGDRDWLPPPEDIVDLRLVRNIDGTFVPIEGPLSYGEGFYLEARIASEPDREVYGVRYTAGSEETTRTIALRPTRQDRRLLRSELHYALWPADEEVAE